MPVFPGLPAVKITVHQSHEQLDGLTNSEVVSPAVNLHQLGEHTGTHVDAINHVARQYREQSIDTMPLSMFYTEGICLDCIRITIGAPFGTDNWHNGPGVSVDATRWLGQQGIAAFGVEPAAPGV